MILNLIKIVIVLSIIILHYIDYASCSTSEVEKHESQCMRSRNEWNAYLPQTLPFISAERPQIRTIIVYDK